MGPKLVWGVLLKKQELKQSESPGSADGTNTGSQGPTGVSRGKQKGQSSIALERSRRSEMEQGVSWGISKRALRGLHFPYQSKPHGAQ